MERTKLNLRTRTHLLFDDIIHSYGIDVGGLEIGRDECICERGWITDGGTINDVMYEVWERVCETSR